MKLVISAFFFSFCLCCLVYAGNIYRCVDENGKIYYTTSPAHSSCEALNSSMPNQTQESESRQSLPHLIKGRSSLPKKPITKGGYVACKNEKWLDDMARFRSVGDRERYEAYINEGKCLILEDGLQVTVTNWPGLLGGKTGFILAEEKFWAVREAIDY